MFDDINKQLDQALADKNFQLATMLLNKMWLTAQIEMTSLTSPDLKELTFLKTPVDTGTGKYLLLFIHVDGQKIQLGESDVK